MSLELHFFSTLETLLIDEWRLQASSKTQQTFPFVVCSAFCHLSFSKDIFRHPGEKKKIKKVCDFYMQSVCQLLNPTDTSTATCGISSATKITMQGVHTCFVSSLLISYVQQTSEQ